MLAIALFAGAAVVVIADLRREVDCSNARPYELMEIGAAVLTGLAIALLVWFRAHRWWYIALGTLAVFIPVFVFDVLRSALTCAN
ncbi:MAG: hypothetical protein M3546_09595 [Actinomycetota bacterium]|nr:hypothetical protein [Actinomycetota bacterium]